MMNPTRLLMGAASCRDTIVAGSHSRKGKVMLESGPAFRAMPEMLEKGSPKAWKAEASLQPSRPSVRIVQY